MIRRQHDDGILGQPRFIEKLHYPAYVVVGVLVATRPESSEPPPPATNAGNGTAPAELVQAADAVGFQFPLNVTMGKHGNGKPGHEYKGDLDEVQIHSAVRGPDWIKLSYENQKPGSSFPERAVP